LCPSIEVHPHQASGINAELHGVPRICGWTYVRYRFGCPGRPGLGLITRPVASDTVTKVNLGMRFEVHGKGEQK
jgi:hypothetical protein